MLMFDVDVSSFKWKKCDDLLYKYWLSTSYGGYIMYVVSRGRMGTGDEYHNV